ncbi:hypothetical protein [Ferrimonas sp.]|uniref:hypothetical protein n=1 Tax=Ferrimonas sp. TaxID=2080861 RepID=UPI003A9187E5
MNYFILIERNIKLVFFLILLFVFPAAASEMESVELTGVTPLNVKEKILSLSEFRESAVIIFSSRPFLSKGKFKTVRFSVKIDKVATKHSRVFSALNSSKLKGSEKVDRCESLVLFTVRNERVGSVKEHYSQFVGEKDKNNCLMERSRDLIFEVFADDIAALFSSTISEDLSYDDYVKDYTLVTLLKSRKDNGKTVMKIDLGSLDGVKFRDKKYLLKELRTDLGNGEEIVEHVRVSNVSFTDSISPQNSWILIEGNPEGVDLTRGNYMLVDDDPKNNEYPILQSVEVKPSILNL